jgi:hypothetical protein
MTQATHTANGQIQIGAQYMIDALRGEVGSLREQSLQLQAMYLQLQTEAQQEISSLRAQVQKYQDAEATSTPESLPAEENEVTDAPVSPAP